ncbi:DUF4347 domain-containing protein [Nostoc parmelioides]|uniref:DUF4347 domain-containing protein n=1 Tax=Nostoc parmelioides FACHB-3921 TaxID=2692909 RepID=A0ABR8BKC6_9NOSO|nr:DUF4347 domain-containing protein [Nostoc parmelioides]MBD2254548.1 DUF4347 domain-containing protein [Nostoc parmelioides FACHB-3921]
MSKMVVFVDSLLAYFGNENFTGVDIFFLDPYLNGVTQITSILSQYNDLDSIQIFSHGSEGSLQLGNSVLDKNTLDTYSKEILSWGKSLNPKGDILLLGCNVATGFVGQDFVQTFSYLTAADIAASDNLTGSTALGGDWELEYTTGLIEAPLAFQKEVLAAYTEVLNQILYVTSAADNTSIGTLRQRIEQANSTPGKDIIDLTGVASQTILLNSSLLTITDEVEIRGANAIIDGRGQYQIVAVDASGQQVTISNLTFQNGRAKGGDGNNGAGGGLGAGGALFIYQGNVVMNSVTLKNNVAQGGNASGGARGGNVNRDGTTGGTGGKFNETGVFQVPGTQIANGGNGGGTPGDDGENGGSGANGTFGTGGGGGGGGGGGDEGTLDDGYGGRGGNGGTGGFGTGGGGGGGGGGNPDSDDNRGIAGRGGTGGQFGGAGANGSNGMLDADEGEGGGNGGTGGGGAGLGGAIFVGQNAQLNLIGVQFQNNQANGGSGANNGEGRGGAVFVQSGGIAKSVSVSHSGNTGSSGDSNTYGSIGSLSVPSVSVSATSQPREPNQTGEFTINLSQAFLVPLKINYNITGSATNGTDYTGIPSSGFVEFQTGETSVKLNLTPTDDIYYEGNETIILNLQSGNYYSLSGTAQATLTLSEDEPLITSVTYIDTKEGGSNGILTITLDKNTPTTGTIVEFTLTGTARLGTQYTLKGRAANGNEVQIDTSQITATNGRGRFRIPPGTNNFKVEIVPIDDRFLEPDQSIVFTVVEKLEGSQKRDYGVSGGSIQRTLTLRDNEIEPLISVVAENAPSETGPTFGTFKLNISYLDPVTGQPVANTDQRIPEQLTEIRYQITGSATAGQDYATLPGLIKVPTGVTFIPIAVNPENDQIDEDNETVTITLQDAAFSRPYYVVSGGQRNATLTITDNDTAAIIVSPVSGNTNELGDQAKFTIRLATRPTSPVTINFSSSKPGEGNTTVSSFTFTTTNWNQPREITIQGVNDTLQDGNQDYTINTTVSSSDAKYAVLNPDDVTLTNFDDDSPNILIRQSGGSTNISEAGTTDTYQVMLVGRVPAADVEVTISPTTEIDLGAGAGKPIKLVFTTQNYSTPQTVTVRAVNDTDIEFTHISTISHSLRSEDPIFDAVKPGVAQVTITDNDPATVNIQAIGHGSEKSGVPGVIRFTMNANAPSSGLPINYTITGGNATAGVDYFSLSGSLQIDPGESGANLNITPIFDDIAELPYETVRVQIAPGTNYFAGSSNIADIRLYDDDIPGLRILESGATTKVTEGGANDTFTVQLTSQPTANVTVNFNTSASGQIQTISPLVFTQNNWRNPQTVTVVAVNDGIDETIAANTLTITPSVSSSDPIYNGGTVINDESIRTVTVNISDPTFSALDIGESLKLALFKLDQSYTQELKGIQLPVFGAIRSMIPGVINTFADGLVNEISSSISQSKAGMTALLQNFFNAKLGNLVNNVQVTSSSNASEITFLVILNGSYSQNNTSILNNLGLPALFSKADVQGQSQSIFNWQLDLGFGIHNSFGAFIDTDKTRFQGDLNLEFKDKNNFTSNGTIGFTPLTLRDNAADVTKSTLTFDLDLKDLTNEAVSDGERLTINELRTNPQIDSIIFSEVKNKLDMSLTASTQFLNLGAAFPSFKFDLGADIDTMLFDNGQLTGYRTFSTDAYKSPDNGQAVPFISFNNLRLDFGTFITEFAKPIVETIYPLVLPFRPIVEFLNADTKIFSELGLDSFLDRNSDGKVVVREIFETLVLLGGGSTSSFAWDFLDAVEFVINLHDQYEIIEKDPKKNNLQYVMGSYKLSNFVATNPLQDIQQTQILPLNNQTTSANSFLQTVINDDGWQDASKSFFRTLQGKSYGFDFHILEPQTIMSMLLGKDVPLVTLDLPPLEAGITAEYKIAPVLKFPFAKLLLDGSLKIKADLAFGYDTYGLRAWSYKDFAAADADLLLDGFYMSDRENPDGTGEDIPELTVEAELAGGVALDSDPKPKSFKITAYVSAGGVPNTANGTDLFKIYAKGGIRGKVDVDVVDGGETTNQSDGRIRMLELNRPLGELFTLNGVVDVFLAAGLDSFGVNLYEKDLLKFRLLKFGYNAQTGFTAQWVGEFVDGRMAGTEVFFDANFNGVHDIEEPITYSSRLGNVSDLEIQLDRFDLNQNGEIDPEEGNIVGVNGVDTSLYIAQSTPLITTIDATIASPLTTLAARLGEPARTAAANQIKSVFGFSSSLNLMDYDLTTVDLSVLRVHSQVQNLIILATKELAATSSTSTYNIASELLQQLAARVQAGIVPNLTDGTTVRSLIQSAQTALGLSGQIDSLVDAILEKNQVIIDALANATLTVAQKRQQIFQAMEQPELATGFQKIAIAPFVAMIPELAGAADPIGAGIKVKAALGLPSQVDIYNFDALEAISVGDATGLGLVVFAKQAQVQNTIVSIVRFLSGALDISHTQLGYPVIDALNAPIRNNQTLNLNSASQIANLILTVAPNLNSATVNSVAQLIAAANQEIDGVLQNNSFDLVRKASEIARIQQVVQGDLSDDLQAVGDGTTLLGDVVTKYSGASLDTQIAQATASNPAFLTSTNDLQAETPRDTSIILDVLAQESTTSQVNLLFDPEYGTLTLNADRTVTYTPVPGFVGEAILHYVIQNGTSLVSRTARVIVYGTPQGQTSGTIYLGPGDDIVTTSSASDIIYASSGNNNINAGAGNNIITSGTGNDNITTAGGNDVIEAGDGQNTIQAGDGLNIITSGLGSDFIYTGSGDDNISAGEGDNTINAAAGNNDITSGSGNDRIFVLDGENLINAGAGNNTITTGNGNNWISTGSGRDVITTGLGSDLINAGDGDNIIKAGGGNNVITTGLGNDQVSTENGNDTITTGDGNDVVFAGAGDDTVDAGAGDNRVILGSGTDTLMLSAGIGSTTVTDFNTAGDILKVADSLVGQLVIIQQQGTDTVLKVGDDTLAILSGVQAANVTVTGTDYLLVVTPNTAPVIPSGQSFAVSSGVVNGTVVGKVNATDAEGDSLSNWTITSGNIDGDKDNISVFAIDVTTGNITVNDSNELSSLINTTVNLAVTVSDGKANTTQTVGITIKPTVVGINPAVYDRTLTGTTGNDYINGNSVNELIYGLAGSDRLYGYAGNDALVGGDGRDYLTGGTGRDIFDGGLEADYYYGEADKAQDIFVLARGESGIGSTIGDAIYYFEDGIDKIGLKGSLSFGSLSFRSSSSGTTILDGTTTLATVYGSGIVLDTTDFVAFS